MKYIRRIIDDEIDLKSKAFDAICIVGPKGCGKTRTASERSKTIIEFQDEEKREGYLLAAENNPSLLLEGEKPILFDEWQDAPKMWGAVRKACDHTDHVGEYYLTGSTSKKIATPHTGTGRISTLEMTTMSLFESGESNGSISLKELIENPELKIDGVKSDLDIKTLIYACCRGGFPRAVLLQDKEASLEIARDYYFQIYSKDISALDGIRRNPTIAKAILRSYARNMGTLAKRKVIYSDVNANYPLSERTFDDYVDTLERLYVVRDIDAWCPQIRSKTAIRAAKKKIFLDPSLGIAALGLSPEYFYTDFDLFGHAFENLVFRDLLAFSTKHHGSVMHYRDDTGMEVDAIYQLSNGDYALLEIKTGSSRIEEASKNLLKFKRLLEEYNEKHPEVPYRLPKAMVVLCGSLDYALTLENGVKAVPIGCLKD